MEILWNLVLLYCIISIAQLHIHHPRFPSKLLTVHRFLSSLPIAVFQTDDDTARDITKTVNEAVVAAIVVAALTVTFIGVAVVYCLFLIDKKTPEGFRLPLVNIGLPMSQAENHQSNTITPPNWIAPPNPIAHNNEKRFTFQQVVEMTDNFKFQLGRGGFGPVYHGKTNTGKEVAVKRWSSESRQGRLEFQTEVDILLRVHHRNLVSLIGYCSEVTELILIYEFMPGGTLDDHLHGPLGARKPLDWETRIRIATDAANGLKYLHTDCFPRIIHRDVKGTNILLDEKKLTGKVADFGLSKTFLKPSQTQVSTAVKGTVGYMDPEYARLEKLTDKSDVYSFGIVLLELLTGYRNILQTPSCKLEHISDWARPYILYDKFNEIVDKSLGDNYNMDAFKQVAIVALSCVESQGKGRLSMADVCGKLEIAKTYFKPALNINHPSQMPLLEQSRAHTH